MVGPAGDPEWASVGMAREASAYPTLSELVAYLRILDSVPVGTNIG